MHIETVHKGDASYYQALVRFPRMPRGEAWWRSFSRRMAAVTGLNDINSAYRLIVHADGRVERLFSAVVVRSSEAATRRFFAGFSFLEGIEEQSVELPLDGDQYESWAGDFPALKCALLMPPLRVASDKWLACDFRAAPYLDELAAEAQSLGFGFSYQVHFCPFTADASTRRRVGRNLIELRETKGVPSEVLADQERQVKRLGTATLLVEEILGVVHAEAGQWLSQALSRLFRNDAARARFEPPAFEFRDGNHDIEPALMMHSSLLYEDWADDDLICSQTADESCRRAILSFHPSTDPRSPSPPVEEAPVSPSPAPTPFPPDLALPSPTEGTNHIFISYRRGDLRRIHPIMMRLVEHGRPIWYDRGLSGGDEWDVVLERKIEEASLVLFFLSQAAVESKYCRREIKFADAINKPLLVVALEAADLRHGLKFLLGQLQHISVEDREFEAQLDRAIRNLSIQDPN